MTVPAWHHGWRATRGRLCWCLFPIPARMRNAYGKKRKRTSMSSAPGPDSIQYRTRNRGMLLRVDSLIVRPSRQEELLFSSADAWVEFFETLPNDQ